MMDWTRLLNNRRFFDSEYEAEAHRPIYVQDHDRIAFSAPFRRLANKTQVHPLYDNDHLHHRLIHSVETSSVGRSLGMMVGHWLESEGHISEGNKHAVAGIVQAACLSHDIGNPPFGHSGESAIGEWFSERFSQNNGMFKDLDKRQKYEFSAFEVNAQGFRILTRLEMYRDAGGMRLSNGVLAAFSKYPVSAAVRQGETGNYCGTKKFGYFEAEEGFFNEVASAVGLIKLENEFGSWWRRHPLVFLVEAADDICYGILDLEDAAISGDIAPEEVLALLENISGVPNAPQDGLSAAEKISYARARGIGGAISACAEAFQLNYSDIMAGSFNSSLLAASRKSAEFEKIKNTARERIFTSRRKTELEIVGRNVIMTTLSGILPVFEKLSRKSWQTDALSGYEAQVAGALQLDFRGVNDAYSAFHAMTDYVSGMTDRYAVRISKILAGG